MIGEKKAGRAYAYLVPSVFIMLFIMGYPIIYNMVISFFRWTLRSPERPFIAFANYLAVLSDERFLLVLRNTFVWTVIGVFLQMVIGIALALFVDDLVRAKKFTRTIILIPWLIPGVITALIWRWMMQADVGIINYILMQTGAAKENILFLANPALAMPSLIFVNLWKAVPFWFLMMTAALQDKPIEQIESATLDGAKYRHILRFIILPHLSPVIAATGVLTTIWTLNYFDIIWATTRGGPMNSTSTLPIFTYRLAFEFNNFGHAAALAVISMILVSLICIPYVKRIFGNLKEEGVL